MKVSLKKYHGLFTSPPETIISPPVHTAVGLLRPGGAPVVVMACQLSDDGLYRPPVFSVWPKTSVFLRESNAGLSRY